MSTSEPVDFDSVWSGLPLQARLAAVTLVAEQAALDHGVEGEVKTIDHGWMVVEQVDGAESLITADAFAALVGTPDERTPPGFIDAIRDLIDGDNVDLAGRVFLAHCNPADVTAAVGTVHEAVTRGTDLTPPAVLRQEFHRRREPR